MFVCLCMLCVCVFVRAGCPDCKRRCNQELRKKLKTLFPSMPERCFNDVLAKESGVYVCACGVHVRVCVCMCMCVCVCVCVQYR